jgi:monoamine oxidase
MPFPRIAILGGGPGGLTTAYLLQKRLTLPCEVVLYEASARLGGKVMTRRFERIPATYEAGAAELYDYSQLGPDPLREMVAEFGLKTFPMQGGAVYLQDKQIANLADFRKHFGPKSASALEAFNRRAKSLCSPSEYYESDWKADNNDPMSKQSFEDLLQSIPDPAACQYVRVAVHSDLATETHHTSAMYGLQNYLMDEPNYMRLYGIEGGIERLTQELAARLRCETRLEQPVLRVARNDRKGYAVTSRYRDERRVEDFDFVVAALPNPWLGMIDWQGPQLAEAIRKHHQHYDYPAHYLRVSLLFDRPFWRSKVSGSYFMIDAFGGCCLYDESSRCSDATHGVLGWLLGGEAAATMSNLSDSELIAAMIESLPTELRAECPPVLEGRVHRWVGSVNGLPGGRPMREPDSRHQPEPIEHGDLFVVGDYLFDSTINGVVDSADTVAEWLIEELQDMHQSAASAAATNANVMAAAPASPQPSSAS